MILLISKQMTNLQCITDLTLKFYFQVRIETQTEYLCGGTYSTLQSSAIKLGMLTGTITICVSTCFTGGGA